MSAKEIKMKKIGSAALWAGVLLIAACAGAREETKPGADPAKSTAALGAREAVDAGPGAMAQAAKGAGAALAADGGMSDGAVAQAMPEPAPTPDAEFRLKKPAPLPVQPRFEAPVPVQRKLKSGARVLVSENHSLPLVSIDVVIEAGVNAEPLSQPGLAGFVADMLDEGTKTRSATQLAEATEDLAAQIGASAGFESSRVHLNCLAETLPQALDLLADLVQNPAFAADDLERVRTLELTSLAQKKASPGALATDEIARQIYGEKNPWGQPAGGTPESLKSITAADLAKFHSAWYRPNNAIISVAGDVTVAQITQLLEERFKTWQAKPLPKIKLAKLPVLKLRAMTALDKPGMTQSQVIIAGRMFTAKDADAVPMRVANLILGGLFTSRLNMNLRERHGYSYGVRSGLTLLKSLGVFTAGGGVVAKSTVESVTEFENELGAFAKTGEVSDDELAQAKEAYTRSLPSLLETNDAVANAFGNVAVLGLPLDYYKKLPAQIARVEKKDVARVATKWLKPGQWPIVIVGPVSSMEEGLSKLQLGTVTMRPVAGPPAPAPAPAPPAAPVKPAAAAGGAASAK